MVSPTIVHGGEDGNRASPVCGEDGLHVGVPPIMGRYVSALWSRSRAVMTEGRREVNPHERCAYGLVIVFFFQKGRGGDGTGMKGRG